MRKLLLALILFFPFIASAQLMTSGGGTGSTTPHGILYGNGTLHLGTVNIGSGLLFSGGTLSSTAAGGTVTNIATTWPIIGGPITTTGTLSLDLATSTLTATSPLTGSFTQVGSGGSLGIQASSPTQNGYLSLQDYNLFHSATTTFSAPLVYTESTNAVTCPTCFTGSPTVGWSFIPGAIFNSTSTDQVLVDEAATTTTATFEDNGNFAFKGTASSSIMSPTAIGSTTPAGNTELDVIGSIDIPPAKAYLFNDSGGGTGFPSTIWGIGFNFVSTGITKTLLTGSTMNFVARSSSANQGFAFIGTNGNSVAEFRNDGKIYFPKNISIGTTTLSSAVGQLNIASSSAPQLDLFPGVNAAGWAFRSLADGSLVIASTTQGGATSSIPTLRITQTGDIITKGTVPTIAGPGTQTISATSTDMRGTINMTANGATVNVVFSSVKSDSPTCIVSDDSTALPVGLGSMPSTTGMQIKTGATFTGNITYICLQ